MYYFVNFYTFYHMNNVNRVTFLMLPLLICESGKQYEVSDDKKRLISKGKAIEVDFLYDPPISYSNHDRFFYMIVLGLIAFTKNFCKFLYFFLDAHNIHTGKR